MTYNLFITFIIPSICRESLLNAIKSLLEQTDKNWNALIIFDGIKNIYDFSYDKRIKIIEIEKIGKAGLVRNIGIKYISDASKNPIQPIWIGFLDDDDYLSPNYITNLKSEINLYNSNNISIDVCIFRMGYNNGYILPTKNDKNINRCKVGISFALKQKITENIIFTNYDMYEDYFYLKELQKNKYKILISSYVSYFIRTIPYKCGLFPKYLL